MFRIQRIRPTEGSHLREVRLRALRSDPDAFSSTHEAEVSLSRDHWDRRAADASSGNSECLFVAITDSKFVGVAGAYTPREADTVRHLYGMWVTPEIRSAGIGRALVEAITKWSSEAGAREVQLWVVENNDSARRMYERAGFVDTGMTQPPTSTKALGEILMRLTFPHPPRS